MRMITNRDSKDVLHRQGNRIIKPNQQLKSNLLQGQYSSRFGTEKGIEYDDQYFVRKY